MKMIFGKRAVSAVLLVILLLSLCACAGITRSPALTTGDPIPPPTAEELRARVDASEGVTFDSVMDWLEYWEFPSYETNTFEYLEFYYQNYYVGDLPDADTLARELADCFIEYMDQIDLTDSTAVTDLILDCYVYVTGDVYAYYFDAEMLLEENADMEGNFVGIGVHVVFDAEYTECQIVRVFGGSPAEEAGIQKGDYFIGVNGLRYPEYSLLELLDFVTGEEDTEVTITVLRDGAELTFTMPRRAVVEETVLGGLLEADRRIGYVRITEFDKTTLGQFTALCDSLLEAGAEALVFDVRDNLGGLLVAILGMLDYLVEDGAVLARYEYYDGEARYDVSEDGHALSPSLPIAVLTNELSVSASELFASALADYNDRGYLDVTLVGTSTFGKGMMQSLLPLPGDRAVRISTAYYNPPYSPNYEGVGVIPDVQVELSEQAREKNLFLLEYSEDTQKQKAVEILLGKLGN